MPDVAARIAPLLGAGNDRADGDERRAVVVLLRHAGALRRASQLARSTRTARSPRRFRCAHVIGCVVHASCTSPEPGVVAARHGPGPHRRRTGGRRLAAHRARSPRALAAAGFECQVSRAHPAGHLVQAVGQHDDEPRVGVHRRDGRPHPRRRSRQRLLPGASCARRAAIGAAIGCPIDADGRGPQRDHAQAGRVQDVDAAGRRGRQAARDRRVADRRCAKSRGRVGVPTPNLDALLG